MNKKNINISVFGLLLYVSSIAVPAHADSSKLKAAYLLNFARFVYWPKEIIDSSNKFNICAMGYGESNDNLNALETKKIKNKKIAILYIKKYRKSDSCLVVYIDKSKKDSYVNIIKDINKDTVLTVSDIPHFANQHGMIGLLEINNKIKFEINIKKSIDSNIKYRSQLLEVAVSLK